MLAKNVTGISLPEKCGNCNKKPGELFMTGYGVDGADLILCRSDALQLARKLLEDLCELDGGRHG